MRSGSGQIFTRANMKGQAFLRMGRFVCVSMETSRKAKASWLGKKRETGVREQVTAGFVTLQRRSRISLAQRYKSRVIPRQG